MRVRGTEDELQSLKLRRRVALGWRCGVRENSAPAQCLVGDAARVPGLLCLSFPPGRAELFFAK